MRIDSLFLITAMRIDSPFLLTTIRIDSPFLITTLKIDSPFSNIYFTHLQYFSYAFFFLFLNLITFNKSKNLPHAHTPEEIRVLQ